MAASSSDFVAERKQSVSLLTATSMQVGGVKAHYIDSDQLLQGEAKELFIGAWQYKLVLPAAMWQGKVH
jgi:hypothetical protein